MKIIEQKLFTVNRINEDNYQYFINNKEVSPDEWVLIESAWSNQTSYLYPPKKPEKMNDEDFYYRTSCNIINKENYSMKIYVTMDIR